MAVTIRQIAEAAGVSRGTVDRVLHNRPGVRPEIAEHIRKIADEMGFLPNKAGKILASKKQPIVIGCFLPSIGNAFYQDVIQGFESAARDLGDFGVLVKTNFVKGYDVKTHIQAMEALLQQGCKALCVSTVDVPEIRDYINGVIKRGFPVIAVNTDLRHTNRLCYVGSDYYKGGCTAAGLFCKMLPRKIELLIVTGSLKIKGHNDRIRGFSRTLRKNHVHYHVVDVFENFDDDDYAYEMTKRVLTANQETNCIYITAAGVAGVCRAIKELNLQDALYVLTYDDIETTKQFVREGVIDFTICQEPEQQGYQSINLLFEYFMSDKLNIPEDYITGTVIKIKENLD